MLLLLNEEENLFVNSLELHQNTIMILYVGKEILRKEGRKCKKIPCKDNTINRVCVSFLLLENSHAVGLKRFSNENF